MLFNYRYYGESMVDSSPFQTSMSFAPDTLRQPTFFSGKLKRTLAFREAISSLHDVVISDLRFHPKDKTEYKQWAAQQELIDLANYTRDKGNIQKHYAEISQELYDLKEKQMKLMEPFAKARHRYFKYLYTHEFNTWVVLDPVITVHPDELFFECFSRDESTYGRLSCNYECFKEIGEFSCGTTNIDYSADLYNEFQKIRHYKETTFSIDPHGFQVETQGSETYNEIKIDLPESWVRGFLQVSAAMTLPVIKVTLHPMDIYNFCFILRRHKERKGPRSMRFCLKPGEPVRVVFEPWDITVTCARSIFTGNQPQEIRTWGRRRLNILERLIPVARQFTLYLTGHGMPAFYLADLGDMTFTLGLSGWTANDWSKAGHFDLMAPRSDVDDFSKQQVFKYLKENWVENADSLCQRLNLDRKIVLSSLFSYAQSGLILYDLAKGVYRVREISRESLPMDQLRFSSPQEGEAFQLIAQGAVQIKKVSTDDTGRLVLEGIVKEGAHVFQPKLVIDKDEALTNGKCTCSHYVRNKLYRGPCPHMLAVRIKHQQKNSGGFKLW